MSKLFFAHNNFRYFDIILFRSALCSAMRKLLLLFALLSLGSVSAQTLTEGLVQTYELQSSVNDGSTPLWLHANRYGLSALSSSNGYVRARVERPISVDDQERWGIGYGLDMAVPYHYTSHLVLQQVYADVRYRHLLLTLGQKEQPMVLKDNKLSSGSQTLGINARPVPGVRLEVPHYWSIPGTSHWMALRGHIFYGQTTDGSFQHDWTGGDYRYSQDVLLHTKAGYLRIGPQDEERPYSLELGLEMACQFGGTLYHTSQGTIRGNHGAKAFWQAFTATGSDEIDPVYHNVGGNQVGSWVARLNYNWQQVGLSLYADHYFEDHSSMFQTDYDGYGSGADWEQRDKSRFLLYPLKDMMVGAEVRLKSYSWLKTVVVEWMNTRYQSGPIYHDHNPGLSDHIGGNDDYYNHYLYQGWVHWGEVMGNPLYRSPLYNTDQTLQVQSNRFYAWHLGVEGAMPTCPTWLKGLDYRLLTSWQRSLGTYISPFYRPQSNYSLMLEATAFPSGQGMWCHCGVRLGLGVDRGSLLGNNIGMQLTIIYTVL